MSTDTSNKEFSEFINETNKYRNDINKNLQKYPHIPDNKTSHDQRYNPNTYISIQSRVNDSEKYKKEYYTKLANEGWVALKDTKFILYMPKGTTFKYILNGNGLSKLPDGTFRSGGWYIGKNQEESEENINKYFLYKGYNGCIFSLQFDDVSEILIKKNYKVIKFKKPFIPSNYPVYLIHPKTQKKEVVYYAVDMSKKKRFESSEKYKKALDSGFWDWSEVTFDMD